MAKLYSQIRFIGSSVPQNSIVLNSGIPRQFRESQSFVESIKDTYKALVGNHKSLATNNHYYTSANGKTFKVY
jgi:hypothetical protein